MTVETVTGASDETALNIAWPADTDFFREGAGHLRIIKQMLKNLFENGKAVDSLDSELLGGEDPSYYLDFVNFTNVPADVVPGDGTLTVSAGAGLSGSGTFSANEETDIEIEIGHGDTSSQTSVSNTGNTVVQSITLDDYGHVTGMSSKTVESGLQEGIYTKESDYNYNCSGAGNITGYVLQAIEFTGPDTFRYRNKIFKSNCNCDCTG